MAIDELEVMPLYSLSSSQGKVGNRRWTLDPCDDLEGFVQKVCHSHWPGDENAVPVQVQVGPFVEKPIYRQPEVIRNSDMGALPQYNKTLVHAQYQLLHITNCWPHSMPKPAKYPGTVMTLRIRGSGQFLIVSPTAFRGLSGPTKKHVISGQAINTFENCCRVLIPITEYHITCDRMTREMYNEIMPKTPTDNGLRWAEREQCVNKANFMGEFPGCLLFDTWEQEDSFVPDLVDPFRYRITANLRARQILDSNGRMKDKDGHYIGWNHDYHVAGMNGGWLYMGLLNNLEGGTIGPRYPERDFSKMFCASKCEGLDTPSGLIAIAVYPNVDVAIQLQWDDVCGATAYAIECVASGGDSFSVSSSGTSYTIHHLNINSLYRFRVRASNGASHSAWSGFVTQISPGAPG